MAADPLALVRYIAESLVDDASAVELEDREGKGGRVVDLRVAPDDMGRVIGREGRIANAIRSLLRNGRYEDRWNLDIKDPEPEAGEDD